MIDEMNRRVCAVRRSIANCAGEMLEINSLEIFGAEFAGPRSRMRIRTVREMDYLFANLALAADDVLIAC